MSLRSPTAGPTAEGPAETGPRLVVRGLTVRFGGLTAVEDVDLDVAGGEVVALIGPNGAGKTTVFNAVCGLVRPTRGTVTVDGRPLGPTAGLAGRGVARTLQGLGLFPGLSVRENVVVGVPRGARDADARADAQLAALGLTARAAQPVGALPYAERATVALARALVARPRLLLLDEPAGGLGHGDVAALGDVIRGVAAEGTGVLLVEHHVDFVMSVSDRVVVLDFGRVIATGAPQDVRRDPRVEEAYLGIPAGAVPHAGRDRRAPGGTGGVGRPAGGGAR
ncbi:ATP-binding cassette domain-containing protein [Cellulomonas fimi]|uniref:ABC transporter ATP-binding protein n=1 Tax=Cellulomonas fimi TaxID=1708 RepID=UPI00234CB906|nr:ATP-binding cassette domain-containing protein [Cellulomonas fimi]MDC7123551.1 ATP-binding cassette domain-containing protein [Cellulomonas fimi]